MSDIVLDVRNLHTTFGKGETLFNAVDGVSFTLARGQTLCIVGESGSGKSVTARSILRILDPGGVIAGGEILYHRRLPDGSDAAVDLAKLNPTGAEIRSIRGGEIAMIFQEPMTSLSPVHTVGSQIAEVIRVHDKLSKKEALARAVDLLRKVEIPNPEKAIDRYVFEFSGGMRQRAMIAMALACNPRVLIADEPTTALDVTTQAEILALIKSLQDQYGMAVLFITHDMGVVAEIADDVIVMYHGKLVESGSTRQIFDAPKDPYTGRLIDSVKRLDKSARITRGTVVGAAPILQVSGLSMHYGSAKSIFGKSIGAAVRALDDVSLDLFEGENLGIVGESGSGKTTLGSCLIRLLEPTSGQILYTGGSGTVVDVAQAERRELKKIHREMRMVFQDPFSSLNPRMTIGEIVGEPLQVTGLAKGDALRRRVAELLEMVSLPASAVDRYPHAFSGGQRQRIGIARALALNPRLIIADEATSALDVTLRSQILDLLLDLQEKLNLSYILISHDLGVIRYFCDRVAVMYRGKIVETGPAEKVCFSPDHDYTKALLSAAPGSHPDKKRIISRHRYVV
jgi:peptide/nickel transport system ATP-binding protein